MVACAALPGRSARPAAEVIRASVAWWRCTMPLGDAHDDQPAAERHSWSSPSHGDREHAILVVGDGGAENITKFPFGPEHNIVAC